MPQEYLSTDPNAGLPAGDSGYLSTDPDAGLTPMASHNTGGGTSTALGIPAAVGGFRGLAAAATRLGEEVATAPIVPKLVKAATGRAVGTVIGGVAGHGLGGAAVGHAAGEIAQQPAVQSALTAAARSGGGILARMAGAASRYAGPLGVVAQALTADTQPTSGPVADQARNAQRQREAEFIRQQSPTAPSTTSYATKFKARVNAETGAPTISGTTADEILASIAAYQKTNGGK